MLTNVSMIIIENLQDIDGKLIASIYHEKFTDVLYIKPIEKGSGFTVMLDPETGLPLTYKVWKEKYFKE